MTLTPTRVLDVILKDENKLDANEVRRSSYGFYEFGKKNADRLISKSEIAKKQALFQNVKIPVINKGGVATTGARTTGAIATTSTTSAYVQLAWHTLEAHFSIQPMAFYGNSIEYEKALARKFQEAQLMMLAQAETYIATQVNSARSIKDNSGAYPFAAGSYSVPNTDTQKVLSVIPSIYTTHDYDSPETAIIAGAMYNTEIAEILQHGANNDKNQKLSLGGLNFLTSRELNTPVGSYELFTGKPGAWGVHFWNEQDVINKSKAGSKSKQPVLMPLLGAKVGMYVIDDMVDGTGTVGATSTYETRIELAVDISVATHYLSDPTNDPADIMKFEIA